jgi:hypothetical protein
MMKCFVGNMDAKIIISTRSQHVAAYVCKYSTKQQLLSEINTALCLAACGKGSQKVDDDPNSAAQTPRERGARILRSMMYSLTNAFEIAAPMCNLYLLRGSPFYASHETVRINSVALLRDLGAMQEQAEPESISLHFTDNDYDHPNLTSSPQRTF